MENSKYDVAKELLTKVGGDDSIQYDSTYSIELAMLEKLGGDVNKSFDSEYSIMKDMLTVINSGGGTVNNQDKTIEITTNGITTVNADGGFTGLGTVTIDTNVPQPSIQDNKAQDIITNGPIEITPDETFDAMSKVTLNVSVPTGGGSNPGELIIDEVSGAFKVNYAINKVVLPDNMDNVTNMNGCFSGCRSLTSITLPELPALRDMGNCFSGCSSLTSITLPSSLPKLTNMNGCFDGCRSLTSITLPDLPLVTNISGCFYNAGNRNIDSVITITSAPKVTNMDSCFGSSSGTGFKTINLPDLPAITDMYWCFARSTMPGMVENITIGQIGNNITTLSNWGINYCPNLTKQSLLNIISALPNPAVGNKICTIGTTNLSKLTPEEIQVATDKGWTLN